MMVIVLVACVITVGSWHESVYALLAFCGVMPTYAVLTQIDYLFNSQEVLALEKAARVWKFLQEVVYDVLLFIFSLVTAQALLDLLSV